MTAKELRDELTKLIRANKGVADKPISMEGCDCYGGCERVVVASEDVELRR